MRFFHLKFISVFPVCWLLFGTFVFGLPFHVVVFFQARASACADAFPFGSVSRFPCITTAFFIRGRRDFTGKITPEALRRLASSLIHRPCCTGSLLLFRSSGTPHWNHGFFPEQIALDTYHVVQGLLKNFHGNFFLPWFRCIPVFSFEIFCSTERIVSFEEIST